MYAVDLIFEVKDRALLNRSSLKTSNKKECKL
jgi:hypothetical protein